MRKAEAWARMTAYEACWQVCLQAVAGMEKEAECFLLDNCAMLKEAFGLSALALRPAAADGSEPARPSWMRLEGGVDRRDAWEAPGRKGEDWREGLGGVVFEDDAGGETGLGSGVSLERECLRIEVRCSNGVLDCGALACFGKIKRLWNEMKGSRLALAHCLL